MVCNDNYVTCVKTNKLIVITPVIEMSSPVQQLFRCIIVPFGACALWVGWGRRVLHLRRAQNHRRVIYRSPSPPAPAHPPLQRMTTPTCTDVADQADACEVVMQETCQKRGEKM